MGNNLYQWIIVTYVSHVEAVAPEQTGLDDKTFQLSASLFVCKQHCFLMSFYLYLVLSNCIYLLLSFSFENK